MPFADIIGHARPIRILRAGLASGRLPHALLFTGPAGVGKFLVAQELARALNCATDSDDSCGACAACGKISRDVHPDVKVVRRPADKTVLSVEQIREVIRGLQYRPYEGRAKVVILDDAEDLNAAGENALLKTLEEPTADSVLVLVTSQPTRLLPTTRSRCQRVRFGSLPRAEVEQAARQKAGDDPRVAAVLAALSGGSLGALRALDPATVVDRWEGALTAAAGEVTSLLEVLRVAEAESGGKRASADRFLALVEAALRDLLVLAAGGERQQLVLADLVIERCRSEVPAAVFHDRLTAVGQARRQLRGNVNPRLVLEATLLRLRDAPPN